MPNPQDPNPSFWRRIAELGGVDDEIDAVTGAARTAGHWIQSQLPAEPTPGLARMHEELKAAQAAQQRQSQATWDTVAGPVKRFFGSAPVQRAGQVAAQAGHQMQADYAPYWTPTSETAAWADQTRRGITERSQAARALLPKAPVTVQGHGALRGLHATVDPMKPLDAALALQTDVLPNFALDSAVDATTPVGGVMNLDVPVGPALHAAAPLLAKAATPLAHLAGVLPPGFYSRVDKIAEQVGKKGVTPQRLTAMLKGSTHPDEVAYRKLNELIASKGNQVITKAELTAHLAQHPPPGLGSQILGEPGPPPPAPPVPWRQPKYGPSTHPTLSVPGGSNYREALSTLEHPRPSLDKAQAELTAIEEQLAARVNDPDRPLGSALSDDDKALMARANALYAKVGALERTGPKPYEGSHHGVANQFAHVRYDQRELPGRGKGRFLQEVQSDWEHAGREHGYAPPDADRQYQEAVNGVDNALYALDQHATDFRERYEVDRPFTPPPYDQWLQEEITPEFQTPRHARDNERIYRQDMEVRRRAHATTALNDAMEEDPTYQQLRQAVRDADARLTTARSQSRSGVPELPFKNVWDEVALKQQLTDIAQNHPDTRWLGLTSGETQAKRYDLSKHLSKLDYDPESQQLTGWDRSAPHSIIVDENVDPADLHKYIGKDRAEVLLRKADEHTQRRQWDRAQWSVHPDVDEPGAFNIFDPNGEPLYDFGGDHEKYYSAEDAHARIDDLLQNDREQFGGRDLPALEGDDLVFGGHWTRQLYDKMLRRRIEKVLQPHGGGKMEPFDLPTPGVEGAPTGHYVTHPDMPGQVIDGFSTREEAEQWLRELGSPEYGGEIPPGYQINEPPAGGGAGPVEPSWITQLSPEVLQSIRDKGFDLMSLVPPALVGGAAAASQYGDEDGQGGGLGAGLASVAPIMLGGRRPVLNLDKTLKYLGNSRYALKPAIVDRLASLYKKGLELSPKATWGGTQHPELLQAFGGDADLAKLWARFFGTTSAGTGVPKNTQESIAALTHALDRPGVPFEATEFAADVNGRLRPRLGLYGTTITNAESKLPSLNRALQGLDPSGPKTEAMSQFMWGQPRSPIDRHVLWGLGSAHDTLSEQHSLLKHAMQKYERMLGRGKDQLNEHKVYSRYEQAIADALQGLDPERPYNALFGDFWEGARAVKGESYQGGPIDILRSRGLLGPNFLTDPDRLKATLQDTSGLWTAQSPSPSPRSFVDLGKR